MNLEEKTLTVETLFDGIVFRVERQDVELGDGSHSQRDIVRHIGGVGVLARTHDGKFLMVKQYRKAVDNLSLEIVAGMRETGEEAMITGERELQEETGFSCSRLHYLGKFLPSPGYTDEVVELFFADLDGDAEGLKLDPDERLEVIPLSKRELARKIEENEIIDGKSIAAWYFAKDKGYV